MKKIRSKQSCDTVPLMSLSSGLFCSGLVVIKAKTGGSKDISPIVMVFRFIIYSGYSRLFNFHPKEEGGGGERRNHLYDIQTSEFQLSECVCKSVYIIDLNLQTDFLLCKQTSACKVTIVWMPL